MVALMSVMNERPEQSDIEEVASIKGIAASFVEKDWFVTRTIGIIAEIQYNDFEVIFSGGTALSKAHNLIQRFSEDVDFRVVTPETGNNRKALSAFKTQVVETLRQSGFTIAENQIKAQNQNRFFSIELDYESYFSQDDALRPHIQIEMTVKGLQLPHIFRPVSSFLHEVANRPPEVAKIGCIDPVESAADKLSAIAWRIPDRVRGGQYDDPSLVRHIHDLAKLKGQAMAHSDFHALVAASMQEDRSRARNDRAISELTITEKFQRILQVLESDREYIKEYDRFVKGLSYATEGNTPDFAEAIEAVRALTIAAVRE
ncbi:MAG: nucleotidyl transferase AbiEii/AbiGii toxin family protein [Acidobacteriota bacterium]